MMIYAQPRIRPEEWDAQSSLGFWDTNGWPNLGQTTRPRDSHQQKKRTYRIVVVKLKESEREVNIKTLLENFKKTMEHEDDGDTNRNSCSWNNPQRLVKKLKDLGISRDYSIIKNTEKSSGDMRRHAATQTPVKKSIG